VLNARTQVPAGRGIGKGLINWVEGKAKAEGFLTVELFTN